jgi:hypothetical protein
MNLADHLRPLLRDHDCVIIPDFGGLVAEYTPARVQPGGRHVLSPPTRQVAFNQALTRNDGLLVDALRQHLNVPAAEAREALRQAVATLHRDLQTQQRTELPGIGVFRQLAGRGLQFEYTGTDNLLTAAFGLPELTVHPVSVTDARLAREQQAQLVPRLRSASRTVKLRRVVPGAAIGLLAGLAVAGLYLLNLHPAVLPTAWQSHLPRWEQAPRQAVPQQAALAQPSFTPATASEPVAAPLASTSVVAAPAAAPVVTPKPTPVVVQAPAQTASSQTNPVEAVPARQAAIPSPLLSPVQPRAKGRKVPAAAAIALADESNIAKPVPMAQRKANTPALTTSYAVAVTAPRPPASSPVVSVQNSKAIAVAPARPAAAHPVAAHALAAHPAAGRLAPAPAHPVAAAPAATPAPVVAPGAAAAPVATTIKNRTGRYYLVVAAYSSYARAEEGRRNLAHAGRPAKVILPPRGSRLYRLSAVDFADKPTATLAANRLRQNPHFDKGLTILPY